MTLPALIARLGGASEGDDKERDRAYWQRIATDGEPLPLLPRACLDDKGEADCAVVCDFYREMSEQLRQQPFDIRVEASARWFCHNHPGFACRGNAAHQGRAVIAALKARADQQNRRE